MTLAVHRSHRISRIAPHFNVQSPIPLLVSDFHSLRAYLPDLSAFCDDVSVSRDLNIANGSEYSIKFTRVKKKPKVCFDLRRNITLIKSIRCLLDKLYYFMCLSECIQA